MMCTSSLGKRLCLYFLLLLDLPLGFLRFSIQTVGHPCLRLPSRNKSLFYCSLLSFFWLPVVFVSLSLYTDDHLLRAQRPDMAAPLCAVPSYPLSIRPFFFHVWKCKGSIRPRNVSSKCVQPRCWPLILPLYPRPVSVCVHFILLPLSFLVSRFLVLFSPAVRQSVA